MVIRILRHHAEEVVQVICGLRVINPVYQPGIDDLGIEFLVLRRKGLDILRACIIGQKVRLALGETGIFFLSRCASGIDGVIIEVQFVVMLVPIAQEPIVRRKIVNEALQVLSRAVA